jgi:hypothetical protein
MSDRGLKPIVADLHDLGYTDAEIALVVERSERRVGQILNEVCPRPARLHSVDDLPFHMKQRVLLWKEQTSEAESRCQQ